MLTLFDELPVLPESFYYYPDFINQVEEQQLLSAIQQIELHAMEFHEYTAKRKVASFGYDYNFSSRKLTKGIDIPSPFYWLIDRVAKQLLISPDQFAELLVTEYPVGSVLTGTGMPLHLARSPAFRWTPIAPSNYGLTTNQFAPAKAPFHYQ